MQRLREIRNACTLDDRDALLKCSVNHPGCRGPEGIDQCPTCRAAHDAARAPTEPVRS